MSILLFLKLAAQVISTCFSAFVGVQHLLQMRKYTIPERPIPTPIVSAELLTYGTTFESQRDTINLLEEPPPKRERAPPVTRILRAACLSEMMFSLTGAITTAIYIHDPSLQNNINVMFWTQAPHWSTQITSFCWMGTLGVYAAKRNRIHFDVAIAHAIIWLIGIFYWGLETYASFYSRTDLVHMAMIIWMIFASVSFVIVGTCWAVFVVRWRRHGVSTGVFAIAKLLSYTIAFFIFVSPIVFADIVEGITSKSFVNRLSSIILALWPTANAVVYMTKPTWCLRVIQRQIETEEEGDYQKVDERHHSLLLSPTQHELKGLEIGEKIGEGIAVVHKGKWRGITVAVKMKSLSLDETADVMEFQRECNLEMQQEAVMMKTLCHPNIVLFMEVGFYHGSICIISEYCTRGSLRDVLVRAIDTSWSTKVRLALGIAHGLQYLHNATPPMIHRDLKSPNVLVDDSWHAKIADFGTLRFAEIVNTMQLNQTTRRNSKQETFLTARSVTEGGMVMTGLVGTTRWMAPEVMRGDKRYYSQVDIYSFGMILWELIHGQLPFESTRWNHQIEELVLRGERLLIEEGSCPDRWKKLVEECWQAKPSKRPTIQHVISTLELIAREERWDTAAPRFTGCTMITDEESTRSNTTFFTISARSNLIDIPSTRWRSKLTASFNENTEEGDEVEIGDKDGRTALFKRIPEGSIFTGDAKPKRSMDTIITLEI